MARKKPIVVMFFHHWDDPANRDRTVEAIRSVTDLYEKHGVNAHYGFVGVVLQQLAADAPETIEKIKKLRMAIGYHGGAGHAPVGPVGHPRDTQHLTWTDAVRAMWQFETHTLDVDTREPVPGKVGGYLAIQSILDIIPLPTDAKGNGQRNTPVEFVLSRMGAGSYSIQPPFDRDAVFLSPLHEPHLFPGTPFGWPATYYGKLPGEDAPRIADPLQWFDALAENLPDERTFVVHCMSHSGFLLTELDRILKHLSDQPQNFQVTHPDSTHAQWLPENAASAFYKKTYGISDLTQLLDFEAPPQPKGIHLCRDEILIASESILNHSLYNTHDGDFAEPPAFVAVGERRISLADAFQALAHSLCDWKKTGALPSDLILPFIHGPLDYPAYQQKVVPVLPNIQFIGYTPTELDRQDVPDANIINNQGLPAAGDLYLWLPTHTLAEGTAVIDAVAELDMSFAVPGVIHLQIPSEESRQDDESKSIEISVNAAEFLYAMAQVFRQLVRNNKPGPVALVSMKITENQRTECVLVKPGGPRDSFIWRSESDPNELDAAWNRVPAVGEEQILWASLPPLGDKVKRKLGRMVGDWQLKKR